MKKLLLTLSFAALIFAGIKAGEDAIVNQMGTQDKTEYMDNNNQVIPENDSDKLSLQNKRLFDLSIREIWNTKLKPFLKSKRFKKICGLAFATVSLTAIFDIAIAVSQYKCYIDLSNASLGKLINITIKDGFHEAVFEKSFMSSFPIAVVSTILMNFVLLTL